MSARPLLLSALALLGALPPAPAAEEMVGPANLGSGLRQLTEAGRPPLLHAYPGQALHPRVPRDAADRVTADVYLDGTVPAAKVQADLAALGVTVNAIVPAARSLQAQKGLLSTHLPVTQAAAAAKLAGVRSIALVHRPWKHIGVYTSQGVVTTRAYFGFRRGFLGAGISIGVLSDSYDLTAPHAALDVRRDDLPGPGNVDGRTIPVVVLAEGDPRDYNTDEGRAMMQIVHDMAPNSKLAFATVGDSQAAFAQGIRALRTNSRSLCDVMVDDVTFPDEPYFSAGIVEQAVEDVTTSATLAGKKVLYYSAAGNEGDVAYAADFAPIDNQTVRDGQAGVNNLQLTAVPASLTSGGFHNFADGTGTVQIAQKFIISGDAAELDFQWNDLFDPAEITSDFNLLVFDSQGRYLRQLSGVDNNFATGAAMELVDLDPNNDGSARVYQIAITRTTNGAHTANHFQYIINTAGIVDGTYLQQGSNTIAGHEGAPDCDAIAAYPYYRLRVPEFFSSYGPVTKYFDESGNRLATPLVIQQPTLAGPDGVSTTVINPFFGTSAAAPHVAAAAAVILSAQGGPGSMTTATMRQALQSTTFAHDLDPFTATANLTSGADSVILTGRGDDSNLSTPDKAYFTLQFNGNAGDQLQYLTIDLSPAGLTFDPTKVNGFPFTIGAVTGGVSTAIRTALVTGRLGTANSVLQIRFTSFPAGGTLTFGIDRDNANLHSGGNSADLLAPGIVTVGLQSASSTVPTRIIGNFANKSGAGYSPADGYGMINVDAALSALGH